VLKNKLNCCPIFFLFEALEKIKPIIGLKFYKKKGGIKITAIPYFLTLALQYKKAIFWLYKSIQLRFEKKLISKVSNELYAINILNIGESLKKKRECYKYAIMFKTVKRFKW
jgi:ribosomal protein S7